MKTPVQWGHVIGGTAFAATGGVFLEQGKILFASFMIALGLLVSLVGSELIRVTPKKEAQ